MFQAKGYYRTTWTNSAAGNLQKQIPLIASGFPDIQQFHPATINVRFEPQIIVAGSDHRTPPLRWDRLNPEVFDIVRVRLQFEGLADRINALLYVPHRSSHRHDPHKHELIAERFIHGLREDMWVIMEGDGPAVELPYEDRSRGGTGKPKLARTIVIT